MPNPSGQTPALQGAIKELRLVLGGFSDHSMRHLQTIVDALEVSRRVPALQGTARSREKRWCADPYLNKITFAYPDNRVPPFASFGSWGEAWAHIVAQRQRELDEAKKSVTSAESRLKFARKMLPPVDA